MSRSGVIITVDTRRRAHELAAEGELSRVAIAAELGLGKTTLWRILKKPAPPPSAESAQDAPHIPIHPPMPVVSPGRSRGRPSPIENDDVLAALVEAIGEGLSPASCAAVSGVTLETLHNWERKAAEDVEPYVARWARIQVAMAIYRVGLIRTVKAGAPGWQGSWALLKSSDPAYFGDRQVIEHRDGGRADEISDEELMSIAGLTSTSDGE